ncbi:DNA-binding transcriptional regulator, LysR family [Chitinasiproducens palmae]|uniref:DNA-binding transcriptional regulator, LysR family n=2 Tax=Chitinasiproducens palmae TaxID=1770053 RepID=A0A1H2PPW4_9BURK|nr:DNA-binding transcriptional regulator, LysR family [Chitinasiproducens palmae]
MLTRTTTKAASLIGGSQSGISRLLSELETLTNLTLFDRQRGRLVPTREAMLLFEEVQRRYAGLDNLREFALQLAAPRAATVKLGTSFSYSLGFSGSVISRFRKLHEDSKVVLSLGASDLIRDRLLAGAVDLGIVAAGRDLSSFHCLCDMTQRAICAVPSGHRLARNKSIALAELLRYPFIAYQDDDMIRWGLTQLIAQRSKDLDIAAVVRYGVNVCTMVSRGVGVGIVQAVAAYDYLESSAIVFRPLEEPIDFHAYLMAPSTVGLSPLAESLARMVRESFEEVQTQLERAIRS